MTLSYVDMPAVIEIQVRNTLKLQMPDFDPSIRQYNYCRKADGNRILCLHAEWANGLVRHGSEQGRILAIRNNINV